MCVRGYSRGACRSSPLLSAGNWGGHGLHLRGIVEGFARAASAQKWLELHGLEHWTHFYTRYGVTLQKRFFDHFLKGVDNGWERTPAVLLQVRHIDRFVERAEHEWPLGRTRWTKLYLNPGECGLTWEPSAGENMRSYAALSDGITLLSPPLEREMEITGPMAARLYASSSTSDADLFVTPRAFDPVGGEVDFQGALDPHTPIGLGWLRASHRKVDPRLSTPYRPYHTHDAIEPLTPGEVYELDVEIWPTSVVLPAGYRIGLTLQGKDFERASGEASLASFVHRSAARDHSRTLMRKIGPCRSLARRTPSGVVGLGPLTCCCRSFRRSNC